MKKYNEKIYGGAPECYSFNQNLDSSFKVSTICLTIKYRVQNFMYYVIISDIILTFYEYQENLTLSQPLPNWSLLRPKDRK